MNAGQDCGITTKRLKGNPGLRSSWGPLEYNFNLKWPIEQYRCCGFPYGSILYFIFCSNFLFNKAVSDYPMKYSFPITICPLFQLYFYLIEFFVIAHYILYLLFCYCLFESLNVSSKKEGI